MSGAIGSLSQVGAYRGAMGVSHSDIRRSTKGTRAVRRAAVVGIATTLLTTVAVVATSTAATAVVATLPDLKILVPTSNISIGTNSDTGDRQLQFTHITWDAGAGPFVITPVPNASTGWSGFTQAIYYSPSPGTWSFYYRAPLALQGVFDAPSDYRYPLTRFTLNVANSDGTPGSLVATSPKTDYCITADTYVGGVPHTPNATSPPQSNCTKPGASLGFSVGWGDQYDQTDNGQPIDLTGVADGMYVLRATVDPNHEFVESKRSNDEVDTTLQISGDNISVVSQSTPTVIPPSVSLSSPAANASVSGTVAVTANASATAPASVASVQFLLDGQPIGSPVTSAPFTLSWNTVGVPLGAHSLSAQVTDTNGTISTSAPRSVKVVAPPCTGLCGDGAASKTGKGQVVAVLTTKTTGDTLIAFVSSDGPAPPAVQTARVSTTGLTWTLIQRSNIGGGDAEVWTATAPKVLNGAWVVSSPAVTGYDQQLTVVAFRGSGGIGTSATASNSSGAPGLDLVATATGSLVYAVGHDWGSATPRSLAAGQQMISQWVDQVAGDTNWVQRAAAPAGVVGTDESLADTAPTADQWNLAGVEVLPAIPAPAIALSNPVPGQVVSGPVSLTANVGDTVRLAQVQFLVDGRPIGKPVTHPPFTTRWDTADASSGPHMLSVVSRDVQAATAESSAVRVDVRNPAPPMTCFVLQAQVDGTGTGTVETSRFHTASAHETLVAFVAGESSQGLHVPRTTVSGAGLAWRPVAHAQLGTRSVAVWMAQTKKILVGARVAFMAPAGVRQQVTVIAMEGVDGVGASAVATGMSAQPAVGLMTTKATSLVFTLGETTGSSVVGSLPGWVPLEAPRFGPSTSWIQYTNVPTGRAGSSIGRQQRLSASSPWALVAVELVNEDGG